MYGKWQVVYGRDKPYKVHKNWEFDGTATIKDRTIMLFSAENEM